MRIIKTCTILFLAALLSLLAGACADISLKDKGGYTVRATNGTGGMLSEVKVGSVTCTDVAPDGVCESSSVYSPNEIIISYKAKLAAGLGEAIEKEVTLTPAVGTNETNYIITLGTAYTALWLENSHESKNIDMIGINFSGTGTLDSLSEIPTNSTDYGYTSYQGITGDVIEFTAPIEAGTPVNGILNNDAGDLQPLSKLTIKARAERNLTVDVALETITATDAGSDGDLDATLAHSVSADQSNIIKGTVVLKGENGGEYTVLARDNGNGLLVPEDTNLIKSSGTNSIEYNSGAVQFTLEDGVTYNSYAVDYRYLDSVNLALTHQAIAGTVKIKTGTTELAADDGEGNFTGSNVAGPSSINYSGKVLSYLASSSGQSLYSIADTPDHIVIQYDYIMGSDNGSGQITGDGGIDNGNTSTIAYDTGDYSIYIDPTEVGAALTITALYADYHAPLALFTAAGNYSAAPGPATDESIAFDAEARSVAVKLANTFVDPGTVAITATYVDDPAAPTVTETVIISDLAGNGVLTDDVGPTNIGTINYDSGKVILDLSSHHSGYTLTSVVATSYSYQIAGTINRAWGGFFLKSKLEDIYVMTMATDGTTINGYWTMHVDDVDYTTNSNGEFILNMVCGREWN